MVEKIYKSVPHVRHFRVSCHVCDGRGQEEETYEDICPNCHGDYEKYTEKTCAHCNGRGYFICDTKCGQHKKKIECDNCDGTGQITCSRCKGEGKEKCPDCEQREKERKEREAEQKKKEEQRRAEEERKRREARERREQEERCRRMEEEERAAKRKERREAAQGCGCLLVIAAIIGFFIWWWLEGFTKAVLLGMWEQVKTFTSGWGAGLGAIAMIVAVMAILYGGWKLIKGKKNDKAPKSTKKRWLFIVLGLLLGFFGVHLLYAKRWFLFLLLWAGFITGNVCSDGKKTSGEPTETAIAQTEDATAKPDKGNGAIGGIGFAVWGLLWLGGTFFIKKDGKGNRM